MASKLLIVEDDNDLALWIQRGFSQLQLTRPQLDKVECDVCGSLESAETILREKAHEIVLLDLNLPDSQGENSFYTLQANGFDVPIVVMTGLDDDGLAVKLVQSGAQDYVVKGDFSIQHLHRVVHYAVERKKLQDDLSRNYRELQTLNHELLMTQEDLLRAKRLKSVGHLAKGLAHEFNNIFSAIMGGISLMKDHIDVQKEKDRAESLIHLSEKGASITGMLLSFSAESDTEPRKDRVDVNDIVNQSWVLVKDRMPRHIQVDFSLDESAKLIIAQRDHLVRVIQQLFLNAFDFSDDTTKVFVQTQNYRPTAEVCARSNYFSLGDYVYVKISDTGQGMSPETVDWIFDPFFTTKDIGRGHGLGLSVVHGLVKDMDGAIFVQSREGVGTEFSVCFPAAFEKDELPDTQSSET